MIRKQIASSAKLGGGCEPEVRRNKNKQHLKAAAWWSLSRDRTQNLAISVGSRHEAAIDGKGLIQILQTIHIFLILLFVTLESLKMEGSHVKMAVILKFFSKLFKKILILFFFLHRIFLLKTLT